MLALLVLLRVPTGSVEKMPGRNPELFVKKEGSHQPKKEMQEPVFDAVLVIIRVVVKGEAQAAILPANNKHLES